MGFEIKDETYTVQYCYKEYERYISDRHYCYDEKTAFEFMEKLNKKYELESLYLTIDRTYI